jgi:hypothetical protein
MTYLAIPTQNTENQAELEALGLLLKLCQLGEIQLIECTCDESVGTEALRMLGAMENSLLGAWHCLKQSSIVLADNIPPSVQQGWKFAFWYAFNSATKLDPSNLHKVSKTTAFMLHSGDAWKKDPTHPIYARVSEFVRRCALNCAPRLNSLKKCFASEAFFVDKLAGKKPKGGLYTDNELAVVQEFWEKRKQHIGNLYQKLPNDFSEARQILGGVGVIFEEMNKFNSANIKLIEKHKTVRTQSLLVTSGRGKNQSTAIAKGSSLEEKLLTVSGSHSVRAIAKCLWSPLYKMTQDDFYDNATTVARHIIAKGKSEDDPLNKRVEAARRSGDTNLQTTLLTHEGAIREAASVYLRCYEDRQGEVSWDALLGRR